MYIQSMSTTRPLHQHVTRSTTRSTARPIHQHVTRSITRLTKVIYLDNIPSRKLVSTIIYHTRHQNGKKYNKVTRFFDTENGIFKESHKSVM
jgi:hypothetical protein